MDNTPMKKSQDFVIKNHFLAALRLCGCNVKQQQDNTRFSKKQ
jgi:hypothetical protein